MSGAFILCHCGGASCCRQKARRCHSRRTLATTSRVYFEDDDGEGTPDRDSRVDSSIRSSLSRGAPIARVAAGAHRRVPARLRRPPRVTVGATSRTTQKAYAMPLRVADVVAVLDETRHRTGALRRDLLGWTALLRHRRTRARARPLARDHRPAALCDPTRWSARARGRGGHGCFGRAGHRGARRGVRSDRRSLPRARASRRISACDAAAMRAAWRAAMTRRGRQRGPRRRGTCGVSSALRRTTWTSSIRRGERPEEIPDAEFVPIEGQDHLGMDTAGVDPILPAVLRTLRRATGRDGAPTASAPR